MSTVRREPSGREATAWWLFSSPEIKLVQVLCSSGTASNVPNLCPITLLDRPPVELADRRIRLDADPFAVGDQDAVDALLEQHADVDVPSPPAK